MKTVRITAYYSDARQYGTIEIPENLSGEKAEEYIYDHMDDVHFDDSDFWDLDCVDVFDEGEV